MVEKLQGTFQNGFIVTNHGMTSLMIIAVERRVKNMIMRKTIVMMMTKRITITKKKRKGERTRKKKRTRRRKIRRKRSRKRKRKKRRRNWIIKMMVILRFQWSKVTMIVNPSVLRKRKRLLLKMKLRQMMMFLMQLLKGI
jgi:hypothetical protein